MVGEQIAFELNTGAKMPAVGLGTWKSKPGEVGVAVTAALEAGYKHIDCASIYGNQAEVGAALSEAFGKRTVQREELFITSKLWTTDYAPEDVLPACEETLRDLGLAYLDLYLLHVPCQLKRGAPFPPRTEDMVADWSMIATWREMEKLQQKGLVRAIGVSNWTIKKLETLKAGNPSIVPAVNQVEAHPLWRQDRLKEYCDKETIHFSAYSPLGSGDRPPLAVFPETPVLLDNPLLHEVAAKLGKSPAQVALRWGVQRGTDVLPKSVNPKRIKENIDVFGWSIPEEDFKALSSIEPQVRILDFRGIYIGEGRPFLSTVEFWDGEM